MASRTRTLVGDRETLGRTDTVVVSPINVNAAVILPAIVDSLSHGYHGSQSSVLAGHAVRIRARGNGDLTVLDSHQQPVAVVASGASKSFTAEGNEAGDRWNVAQ